MGSQGREGEAGLNESKVMKLRRGYGAGLEDLSSATDDVVQTAIHESLGSQCQLDWIGSNQLPQENVMGRLD